VNLDGYYIPGLSRPGEIASWWGDSRDSDGSISKVPSPISGLATQGRNSSVRQKCKLPREVGVRAKAIHRRWDRAALFLGRAKCRLRDPSSAHLVGERHIWPASVEDGPDVLVEVVLAGLKTAVDVAADLPQEFPRRRSRRIGFQIVRISRLGNDQNEFDLAEVPEGAAESTGGMSALWDPPHCAADGSKAGTRSVGRE
jgi:hypothetical protein